MVSVVMIDSRSDSHPEWVGVAIESIKNQIYPCELIVVKNTDRKKTIGKCWNEGVKESSGNYVLFLGDDDWITRDYISVLVQFIDEKANYVAYTTYMTAFEDSTGNYAHIGRITTGMWRKDYLVSHPFNESLKKGVDREYIEEAIKDDQRYLIVGHHFGYFYRKHEDYSCAGKITFFKDPKNLYIATTYRAFIDPIAERLKSLTSVYIGPGSLETEMADNAKLIWAEWATNHAVEIADYKCSAKKILRVHAYDAFGEAIKYLDFSKYDKVIFVAKHIMDYVQRYAGKLPNAVLIPNGVDEKRYKIADNKVQGNKIAWAGVLANKKGAQLLLILAKSFPEYEFHVACRYSDDDIAELITRQKTDNFIIHPYQYELEKFFSDKTYILNTSPREGCPVTVLEGMSAGLCPLVYDWVGAKDIFTEDNVYGTEQEFRKILESVEKPEVYRQRILDKYTFDEMYAKIETIVKELL